MSWQAGAAGGAAAGAMMVALRKWAKKPPLVDPETGNLVLVLPKTFLRVLACIGGFGIGGGCVVGAFFLGLKVPAGMAVLGVCGFLFLLLGWGLWAGAGRRVVLTGDGIEAHSPFAGQTTLAWSEVQEVRCSGEYFVLTAGDGRKAKVNSMMRGILQFIDVMEMHVPAERRARAAKGIDNCRSAE